MNLNAIAFWVVHKKLVVTLAVKMSMLSHPSVIPFMSSPSKAGFDEFMKTVSHHASVKGLLSSCEVISLYTDHPIRGTEEWKENEVP